MFGVSHGNFQTLQYPVQDLGELNVVFVKLQRLGNIPAGGAQIAREPLHRYGPTDTGEELCAIWCRQEGLPKSFAINGLVGLY